MDRQYTYLPMIYEILHLVTVQNLEAISSKFQR
jgi:hypothetical protein